MIYSQIKLKYFPEETPMILHYRLCELSALIIPDAVSMAFCGYKGIKQTGKSRYFLKMSRDEMNALHDKNIKRIGMGQEKLVAKYR